MKKIFLCLFISLLIGLILCELITRPIFLKRFTTGKFDKAEPTVLILGDSQSLFYPDMLRKQMSPFNVINVSESGTTFDHYLAKMKRIISVFHPNVIVVAVNADNDVLDIRDFLYAPRLEALKLFLLERFSLCHILEESYVNYKYRKYRNFKMDLEGNTFKKPNPMLKEEASNSPDIVLENILISTPELEKCWILVGKFLWKMKRVADKHDTQLVVFVIPASVQVHRKYEMIFTQAGYNIPNEGLMQNKIQNRLKEIAIRYDIHFFDPLEQMQSLSDKYLFYTNDTHLNKEGRKVISELLAAYLKGIFESRHLTNSF